MEIIGIVILNYVFGLLGASLRFIALNFRNLIQSKKLINFKDVWSDNKTKKGKYDNYLLNVIFGAVLFFLFTSVVIKFNL